MKKFTIMNTGLALLLMVMNVAFICQTSQAFTLNFDTEFSGAQSPEGAGPWVTADFVDTGFNTVQLTISASGLVENEHIDLMNFNFDPTLDLNSLSFAYVSGQQTDPVNTVLKGVDAFKPDGDGDMDIEFRFPKSGNRFIHPDTSVWDITYASADDIFSDLSFNFGSTNNPKGSLLGAAHIKSIDDPVLGQNEGSGWIAPSVAPPRPPAPPEPVPEPTTVLLLGIGLAGLAGVSARRRRKKKAVDKS